jgi:hypothetical protein
MELWSMGMSRNKQDMVDLAKELTDKEALK